MPRPKTDETGKRKRLTDYVDTGLASLEGEQIKNDEILGEDIELLDYASIPSKEHEGNFLVLQFKRPSTGDKLYTTSIGAKQVVEAISQMPKQYLPVDVKIVERKAEKTGRMYKTIE